MITINNLSIELGRNKIINNLDLSASTGEILCVIGPNGAGKSTLIRALAGTIQDYSGKINYNNDELRKLTNRKKAQIFSYLPQNLQYEAGYFVEDFIKLANSPWEDSVGNSPIKHRLEEALEICNVTHLRNRRIETLSGGERQRVFVAQVVFQDTPIVLLDEPTTFLDLKHVIQIESVIAKLQQKNKLIFCVTHDIALTQHLATHILGLKNGNSFLYGTSQTVLTSENIAGLFDVDKEIINSRYQLVQQD